MSEAIRFAIEKRQKLKQELVLQQEDFLINTVSGIESILNLALIRLDLIFGHLGQSWVLNVLKIKI